MQTECIDKTFVFQPLDRRDVVGRFDGGTITSDADALLLREVNRPSSVIEWFRHCFTEFRSPERIEHELAEVCYRINDKDAVAGWRLREESGAFPIGSPLLLSAFLTARTP